MNRSQVEVVVREAIESLPDWVSDASHNVEVLVLDAPDVKQDPEGQGLHTFKTINESVFHTFGGSVIAATARSPTLCGHLHDTTHLLTSGFS